MGYNGYNVPNRLQIDSKPVKYSNEQPKVQKVQQYQYEYSSSEDDNDQNDVQSVASNHFRQNVMPPVDDEDDYKSNCQSSPTPPQSHMNQQFMTDTASIIIDENCSVFEPGAPSELNKKLQRERKIEKQNQPRIDYRGYVLKEIENFLSNEIKYAVVIDFEYDDDENGDGCNRIQCKIIDHLDDERWINLNEEIESTDVVDIEERISDDIKMKIFENLSPKQIVFVMKMCKLRAKNE